MSGRNDSVVCHAPGIRTITGLDILAVWSWIGIVH